MRDETCLAVETGGTKMVARIVRGDHVVAEERWPTTTPRAALDHLIGFAADAKPDRIGIAAFGPVVVDPSAANYGEVLETTKPHWTGANLRAALSAHFGVPAAVDTDVNAAALAEAAIGAGRGFGSVAYVTVGTGIGAGLARGGRTLVGALHPEFGHVPVLRLPGDTTPSLCRFHPSCAEGLAAGPAVRARLNGAALEESPDDMAVIADYLGQVLATIVFAWSPHRIVAGGGVMGVAGLREAAAARMIAALGGYGFGPAAGQPGFVVAPELENAGLDGALIMARSA